MLKVDGNCDNLQRSHVAEIFVPSKMLNFKIQEYYWSYIIEVSCKDFELKGLLYPYSLFCVKLVANPSKKKKKSYVISADSPLEIFRVEREKKIFLT